MNQLNVIICLILFRKL